MAVSKLPTSPDDRDLSPTRTWATPQQPPAATVSVLPSKYSPEQPLVSWTPNLGIPAIGTAPANPMPENSLPPPRTWLRRHSTRGHGCIAPPAAFHNSSRKTLNYIPPSVQNGEVLVRPTIDMIRKGSNRWNTTAVGYFLASSSFQFKTMAAMEEVLEGGPWLFLGQPIVLQKWEPSTVLRKLKHTKVPIWIKFSAFAGIWTTDGLSTVASGIGRPLYLDAITRACMRLDFARVCIMLNVNSKLPKHIVIMMPNEHGGESAYKVDLEYEWLPPKCTSCTSLGHATKDCPLTKPVKPAVSVYVRKNQIPAPESRRGDSVAQLNPVFYHPVAKVDMVSDERSNHRRDKAMWNVRGLNRTDHQVAVRDLVTEVRLHFIALLETRVMPSNVCRLQAGLLSRWRWFVDYSGPGNRIWIAWNDDFIDVDILDIGTQFVHCRGLTDLAVLVDLPWLVGGDFNAVLDMSEVSGASGDIRVAMNEFNDCILQTGLISLPMQGERFSWHNCSTDGRSLWKRLDCMFVNDAWMERWPNLFYTCLTPRTSDHSPLVLKGDSRDVQVSMFRFDNYLALSSGFLASVHNIWQHPVIGFLEVAQKLLQVDRHNSLLLQLENCCRLVYLKATKLEHVMLRQRAKFQWLKGGDQCSKVFFRRVATRRANKRIFQISDNDGLVQKYPTTISSVFVAYFQAMCDIEEDKAPRPDGFSSGFYKAAWLIVGEEISKAIMDFFTIGRPISCYNGIYKVITKIIVCRIREILDLLISPSQNAFVSSRLISDNVLLAQELFSGYNQCRLPPRCALKGDIRKAYDTVEWDFLFATLQMFGFPAVFIRWIEECVTSAHFSIFVNGGVHGFFAGARGLRQGDPMSLYLFVLVMEVPQMILQQFIEQDDDLLLLCKADVRSVNLFRQGLDLFASLSGLHINPQKSQLIISKAASGLRDSLLETLGFQEGHLPVRYLGLPLISAHLSIVDCQPLLQKIDSRIKGWEGVQLSFAGRVQLIKSVLVSLEVYWAMAFILQKGIIKEMIKRLRTFLWKGTSSNGYPKVAWEVVCRRIEEGGQGIKDIFALNRALMSKHLWAVIKQDQTSIWVDWIIQVRLRDCSIWTVKKNKGAWGWRKMLTLRHTLLSHIHFRVGDGNSFLLWHNPWHPLGSLIIRFPRGPQLTNTRLLDKLTVVMEDGQWNWPMITDIACLEITQMFPPISEGPDIISWKSNDGSFNTSAAYALFHPPGPKAIIAFCARMESPRHMTTFSLHALFPADVLPLSDSRYHFIGPTVIGNEEFNGRHPDGEESMWLMQHFNLYWPH
ncbi:UNVERIFIED_CONTAM: hypothetical protein Sangu_0995200 [Sesamum angustifolium]|uniref:Reverse transcriptase domain-containing protein n=1 Tax=Sesamum angustifolium TaxID=2727405 RepID=A0AAW2PDB9_9LAMI